MVNHALIGGNIAVFIWMYMFAPQGAGNAIRQFGVIPCELISHCNLEQLRNIFLSMFMHGGLMHLLGNMWFLWIFGDNVEDRMGPLHYLLFYLLCGTAADAAHALSNPGSHIPTIGASGAISGVMSAYVLLYPKVKVKMALWYNVISLPAWVAIGQWFVWQLLAGTVLSNSTDHGVAWFAHVGGFLAGLILVYFFKQEKHITT